MKTLHFLLMLVLSVALIACNNKEEEILTIDPDTWDYPIRPDTEEWNALDHSQRRDTLQIPKSILKRMSTPVLAKVCMDYPLVYHCGSYDNDRYGIELTINSFNGFGELIKREGGTQELVKIYRDYPTPIPIAGEHDYYANIYLSYFDLLLTDPRFIEQLNEGELTTLKEMVKDKYIERLRCYTECPFFPYMMYDLFLGAVITDRQSSVTLSKEEKEELQYFIRRHDPGMVHYDNYLPKLSKIIFEI